LTQLNELQELFQKRLATVDQRHSGQTEKERTRIKGEITRMLKNIDGGTPQLPKIADDEYRGEF